MNLCRHRRQIYSLLPLTTRAPLLFRGWKLEVGCYKKLLIASSLQLPIINFGTLKGIRTPVARMKTWYPRPLDDEGT